MKIERVLFRQENGRDIPAVEIIPRELSGRVVLMHGYGGCKEE